MVPQRKAPLYFWFMLLVGFNLPIRKFPLVGGSALEFGIFIDPSSTLVFGDLGCHAEGVGMGHIIIAIHFGLVAAGHAAQVEVSGPEFLHCGLGQLVPEDGFLVIEFLIHGAHVLSLIPEDEAGTLLQAVVGIVFGHLFRSEVGVIGGGHGQLVVAEVDRIVSLRLDAPRIFPCLALELLGVCRLEVGIGLFLEVVIMSPHPVLALLHVLAGISCQVLPVVVLVVGRRDRTCVVRAQLEMVGAQVFQFFIVQCSFLGVAPVFVQGVIGCGKGGGIRRVDGVSLEGISDSEFRIMVGLLGREVAGID